MRYGRVQTAVVFTCASIKVLCGMGTIRGSVLLRTAHNNELFSRVEQAFTNTEYICYCRMCPPTTLFLCFYSNFLNPNAPRGSQELSQIPRAAEGCEDASNDLQRQARELARQCMSSPLRARGSWLRSVYTCGRLQGASTAGRLCT